MRPLRTLSTLIGSAVLVFALTGCPRPAENTETPKKPSDKKGYTIAVVPKGTSQSFWQAVKAGAEDAAKENSSKIEWNGPQAETEISRQIEIVESAITSKVDAIVMAACDAKGLEPSVKKALDAKIPVVVIDSGIDPDISTAFLATDNVKGGEAAADALAKVIGSKGKVGLIPFVKGAGSSDDRENGFKEGIKKYPGIDLGDRILYSKSDVNEGINVTLAMVQSNPDLAGIFAANQGGAEGVIQAIKQAGKAGKIKLVCYDASDAEIDALKDGTVQALIVQNPYRMGYEGVRTAIKAIKGDKIEQHKIDTGVTVITKDNLETPDIQKLLYPTGKK